jgi:hypothetical protein
MKLANGIGKVPSSVPISYLPRNLSRPHHFSRSFLYLLQIMGLLFFPNPRTHLWWWKPWPSISSLWFDLPCSEVFFFLKMERSNGWCGRLPWLWWEGQLLWLLWSVHLTVITQTMFAPIKAHIYFQLPNPCLNSVNSIWTHSRAHRRSPFFCKVEPSMAQLWKQNDRNCVGRDWEHYFYGKSWIRALRHSESSSPFGGPSWTLGLHVWSTGI